MIGALIYVYRRERDQYLMRDRRERCRSGAQHLAHEFFHFLRIDGWADGVFGLRCMQSLGGTYGVSGSCCHAGSNRTRVGWGRWMQDVKLLDGLINGIWRSS